MMMDGNDDGMTSTDGMRKEGVMKHQGVSSSFPSP